MKKHRSSATNIKHVAWQRPSAQTDGQRIVLGVDVAKDDFFGVLPREDRSVCVTLRWVHPAKTRELSAHLVKDLNVEDLEVAMEPSRPYADARCSSTWLIRS